jgi:hypothetical protein
MLAPPVLPDAALLYHWYESAPPSVDAALTVNVTGDK